MVALIIIIPGHKLNVVCLYYGMLLKNKKEQNIICRYMPDFNDLKIILSERDQSQKNKYGLIPSI